MLNRSGKPIPLLEPPTTLCRMAMVFIGIRSFLWSHAALQKKCLNAELLHTWHPSSCFQQNWQKHLSKRDVEHEDMLLNHGEIERFWKTQTLSESLQQCSHCSSDMRKVWATCTNLRPTLKRNNAVIEVPTSHRHLAHLGTWNFNSLRHAAACNLRDAFDSEDPSGEGSLLMSVYKRKYPHWRNAFRAAQETVFHCVSPVHQEIQNKCHATNLPLCGPPTGRSTPKTI